MKKNSIVVSSAAVAALALLAAGCGGRSHSSDVATVSTNASAVQHLRPASASDAADALKASRCMRSHGVHNFPDPILGGRFGFTADSGINPDTPQYKAAYSYCATRYLHFRTLPPAELARRNAAAVKYSACMRSHGASEFPDPDGQAAIRLPTDNYEHTPNVQRAEEACKSLLTGKGFVFVLPVPVL